MQKAFLDVIVPCFNPQENWSSRFINMGKLFIESLPNFTIRYILINDGSTRNITVAEINTLRSTFSHFTYIKFDKNKGKGAALRNGFEVSEANFIVFTDIDFPYRVENMYSMVSRLQKGADIVIGLRDENYYTKVPEMRAKLSKSFKKIIQLLFNIPTTETQAGLKAFSLKGKEVALQTTINRYLFDLELVKLASKKQLKFAYVKLSLNEGIILSKMPLKILFKEFFNLLKIIF